MNRFILLLLPLILLVSACGKYESYDRSYSEDGLVEAVSEFDIATLEDYMMLFFESKSAPTKRAALEETKSFQVMKQYRYSIYMAMYDEFIYAQACKGIDPNSMKILTIFPAIQTAMKKTLASYIINPLEKTYDKRAATRKIVCDPKKGVALENGEFLSDQRIWLTKMERFKAVINLSRPAS